MKTKSPIHKQLEYADRRGDLIPCLLSLESRIRRQEYGPVLCELHNSGKISLVSDHNLAVVEDLDHNEFWSIVHLFDQAIPELDCSIRDVLRLVHTLVSKAGSDGAAGMPNISLVKWCKVNPEKAKLIVDGAISLDKLCLSHCVFAVQALGSIELAFELLGHSDKAVVAVGLRSLGRLEVGSETIAKRVIDECCKVIAIEKDQDVRSSAIETAFNTWGKFGSLEPYRQQEFLEAIINAKEGDELVQLSAALFYHSKGVVAESIDIILEALAGEVSNPQATLHWLDHALHAKDEGWDLTKVIDVFAAQIPKLENSIEPSQLHNFCQWIWRGPDNAAQLFSSWLVSGQFDLCKFLADMVGEGGKKNNIFEISRARLPNDLNDQVFLARKCVGFLWHHEVTAASILLSIVKNGKKLAREEAEELLYNPLLLSYSGALRSFLDEQSKKPSKRISGCIKRLIKRHDAYLEGLKSTEHLVEFCPTIEQRRTAAIKDRERNKEIQKQAHERSVFFQLVSCQTLLYGKKSFSLIHGEGGKKVPSVTPLSEFSYSAEFPRLSVVDPVGFNEMLTIFRIEKKVSQ
ncbi:hypothetical protein [Halomonas elongata]|uniref:Uncharacterized protein n=1 Tax=Halomonas elongata (strain ATCC 33173 / DSM 2581 / NBRC 15536 / NCIMB 2198 / 1H9) TaxID=768066 RepID=A0A1R4A4F2_HALED|nr:hypothetical protein [Halomonas elongata]WBF16920.1 hypothetical protein LM502_12565 [Halomonas elongata]WPU45751.1 hypothetical protein SR933_10790 [Halomonas elongata DSM 2581]SJK83840.1 uncharacterized protein HELO_3291C [Halomonas elongata DSM 2581]